MVVVQLIGGLGNQMFQYACGLHLARLNNTELKLDVSFIENRMSVKDGFVYRVFELDIFQISAEILDGNDFPLYPKNWSISNRFGRLFHLLQIKMKGFKYVMERSRKKYDRLLFKPEILKKKGNIYLVGYWQSAKYFKGIQSLIREEFKFKNPIIEESKELLADIMSGNSVCIHVRRTDLLSVKQMGFHGIAYYDRAIKELSSRLSALKLFVFSDDLDWCKENLHFEYPTTFVGQEHNGFKNSNALLLMSSCKHFIVPNSSYSWWAAYISDSNEKIVVAPKNYHKGWNTHDIVPIGWLRV